LLSTITTPIFFVKRNAQTAPITLAIAIVVLGFRIKRNPHEKSYVVKLFHGLNPYES